jgi:hypothetical protein
MSQGLAPLAKCFCRFGAGLRLLVVREFEAPLLPGLRGALSEILPTYRIQEPWTADCKLMYTGCFRPSPLGLAGAMVSKQFGHQKRKEELWLS